MKIRIQSDLGTSVSRVVLPASGNRTVFRGQLLTDETEAGPVLELWRFFRRNPVRIIFATLLGILGSTAFTLSQTRIYEATATLELQELNENFMDLKDALPVSEGNQSGAVSGIQTQERILTSNTLLGRVLAKLPKEPAAPPSRLAVLLHRKVTQPKPGTTARSPEAELEHARQNLHLKDARQTRIVDVSYDSSDPAYAAAFVNTLAQEYIDLNAETRWKMSKRTADWLGLQLAQVRKKLADSEDRLQDYARRSKLLFTAEKQNPSEAKLRQIQESFTKAQEDRVAKQALLETSQSAAPEALPEVLNDATLRDYQNKLTDLRRQRAELGTVFKPNFDLVKRVDAQISALESALKAARANILQRIRNDYESAVRREKLLDNNYAAQSEVVSSEGERAIQYNMLTREVESNRQVYESMLNRVNETSMSSAMRASNVRVVDPGVPPTAPFKPVLPLSLLWGGSTGLLFGVAMAVVSERADRRIRKPGELAHFLNVPELGAVPSVSGARAARSGYAKRRLPTGDFYAEETAAGSQGFRPALVSDQACVELVAWQQRSSDIAESFRGILTSILLANGEGDAPRVIVVTSALGGEGKTTVASNLAVAMARMGKKVLLIDADLRRPRLHQLFNVVQDYGIFDLLTAETRDYRALLSYVIQETSIPGAYLLVSGPRAANATGLLFSEAMIGMLGQARESFDMVIVDTPPVLELPDARLLGRISDGVVLVVRAGATACDVALTVKERLQEDGVRLLGTVLNSWRAS